MMMLLKRGGGRVKKTKVKGVGRPEGTEGRGGGEEWNQKTTPELPLIYDTDALLESFVPLKF